jgi:hypothetical protein
MDDPSPRPAALPDATAVPDAAEVDRAVRHLVGRYCAAVYDFDEAAFAACWTEDATWVAKGTVIAGRARILRVFAKLRQPFPLCVQEPLSGVIDPVSATEAHARWIVRETQWTGEDAGVVLYGTYRDRCVRDDDGLWRFVERRFDDRFRGPVPMPGTFADPV